MMLFRRKTEMVDPAEALAGRTDQTMPLPDIHFVNGHPIEGPWPDGHEVVIVGMGCFWGAERMFWTLDGVYSTFVGYAGGYTPNPSYEEVCSGRTGHTEIVGIVYDPEVVSFERIMQVFWEGHDPTQGMRQGNDVGTQYRSAVYTTTPEQAAVVESTRAAFQERLAESGYGEITTEVRPIADDEIFYAEPYHQQYLAKNPNGYCGIGGTGVSCPIGLTS
ncbi:MAG: peptide-methionine (S)-S-oxide reductase MsrA [Actinomycetota bacterium]